VEQVEAASKTAEAEPPEPGVAAVLVEEVLAEEKEKAAAKEEPPSTATMEADQDKEMAGGETEKMEPATAEPEAMEKTAAQPPAKKQAVSRKKSGDAAKSAAPAGIRQVKVVTESSSLNVRKAPSATADIIAKVKKGAVLRVIEEKGDWVHIAYAAGKSGWVSKKFVRDAAKAPEKKE
jgi:uncharacterized protein YgiM (DUF1202 family)